jgi:hypothetical protein
MTPRKTIVALACGLLLAACARQVSPTSDRGRSIAAAEAEIRRSEATLANLGTETQPDCVRVCRLVTNICDLAQRICTLAKDETTLHARCTDAGARCERARASAARCVCR